MAELIENYIPQDWVEKFKKQAKIVWLITCVIATIWLALIIFTPILEAEGIKSVSQPIYKFFSWLCHQISSRSFHYHEHQFAVCARCFGVYAGFLLGLIVYPFFRKLENVEPFPRVWLFLAMIPMGIDFSLGFFEIWENTHLSRVITGGILGFACAIFIIPALVEIAQFLTLRKKRAKKLDSKPFAS
jgi:uncharacterized membrane protein